MIKPTRIAGPWKGLVTALSPDQVQPQFVTEARNVHFKSGRMATAPPLRTFNVHPEIWEWVGVDIDQGNDRDYTPVNTNARLEDFRQVFWWKSRTGSERMLYVTGDALYAGGLDRVFKISVNPITGDDCGWSLARDSWAQMIHYMAEATEWLVLSNGSSPYVWRLNLAFPVAFEKWEPERSMNTIPLFGGKYMSIFGSRIVFGNLMTPDMDQTHGVGWWGINGPFDVTFPTTGTMPLTDTPGDVKGLSHIQDYLAIWKSNSISVAQKTHKADIPFAFITRVTGIGCSNWRTIQQVAAGNANIFLADDRTVQVFDVSNVQPVDEPISNLIKERDPATAWSHYDAENDLYMLFYPDLLLCYNTREQWWTTETLPFEIHCAVPSSVLRRRLSINELTGTIDNLTGSIDELGAGENRFVSSYFGFTGSAIRDPDSPTNALIRTAEIRLEKPTTLTRLLLRVRAEQGSRISVRHSLDGGSAWYPWQVLTGDDLTGVSRVTYDFVDTSEQFTFEIEVVGLRTVIEDAVIDIVVHQLQEGNVTPFTLADYSLPS